jgi:GNAT superfamily N-acetyltransferase
MNAPGWAELAMSDPMIRRATPDDLVNLVRIYLAAQRWLAEIGSDQWANNTEEKTQTRLADSIERGACWLAELDGKPVGMITVDGYADPEFWTAQDDPDDALYVHRMVVDRLAAGNDVGGRLLDWAEHLAGSLGRKWLRLDAWRTNTPLHAYYQRQGFVPVRTVNLSHRGSGALFQRRVRNR